MTGNCNHESAPQTRALVKSILDNAQRYPWSIQGLGMLRLHLSEGVRLHVWDSSAAVTDGDSTIHTHPWDFHSYVVSGEIRNQRFTEHPSGLRDFNRVLIRCGEGGGAASPSERVSLITHLEERYLANECYEQKADEIHETTPADGTVTLVTRMFRPDTEHAYVYYFADSWRSAEPRAATQEEVGRIVGYALSVWL